MSRVAMIWHYSISDGVPRRALAVAAIVGSILNLINQGDRLFGTEQIDFAKVLLTFVVPYCVATYGAVSYRMRVARHSDRTAPGDPRAKL
jgi:hypothetical protein